MTRPAPSGLGDRRRGTSIIVNDRRRSAIVPAPIAATAADSRNAAGNPLASTTTPSTAGATPNDRSRNALVVPTTEPRSVSSTRDTATAISAGNMNAIPTAKIAVPMSSPASPGTIPMKASPMAVTVSAAPARRAGPIRSGSDANAMRRTTTMIAYSARGSPAVDIPTSVATRATNAKNPAIPHAPVRTRSPGRTPAGWNRRPRGRGPSPAASTPGADSRTNTASTVAKTAIAAAAIQTAS